MKRTSLSVSLDIIDLLLPLFSASLNVTLRKGVGAFGVVISDEEKRAEFLYVCGGANETPNAKRRVFSDVGFVT